MLRVTAVSLGLCEKLSFSLTTAKHLASIDGLQMMLLIVQTLLLVCTVSLKKSIGDRDDCFILRKSRISSVSVTAVSFCNDRLASVFERGPS